MTIIELDIDTVRALRRLFQNGVNPNVACKIVGCAYVTASRYFERFRYERKAEQRGDLLELNFLPEKTFMQIVEEAAKRGMTTKFLVTRILSLVVRDDLYSAVLDYEIEPTKKMMECAEALKEQKRGENPNDEPQIETK